MVAERLGSRGIDAEAALLRLVVPGVVDLSRPATEGLDAKVVVRVARQTALAGTALKDALRQRDAGGYAVLVLLVKGYLLVGVDVAEDVGLGLRVGRQQQREERTNDSNQSFHCHRVLVLLLVSVCTEAVRVVGVGQTVELRLYVVFPSALGALEEFPDVVGRRFASKA